LHGNSFLPCLVLLPFSYSVSVSFAICQLRREEQLAFVNHTIQTKFPSLDTYDNG